MDSYIDSSDKMFSNWDFKIFFLIFLILRYYMFFSLQAKLAVMKKKREVPRY